MLAVIVPEFGGPEVLTTAQVPDVHAPDGHVRVRVHFAAVNPTDVLLRRGAQRRYLEPLSPPFIPGMDLAGVVDEVGRCVVGVRRGDEVMAAVSAWRPCGGAQAEFVTVPQASVIPVPVHMSLKGASTLPMNAMTVYATYSMLALPRGSSVVVFGAAGAVGGLAVEMGRAQGFRVVAVADEKDFPLVRRLGAHVTVARGPDAAESVRAELGGGADAAIDAARVGRPVLPAVRDEGRIVSLMPFPGNSERGIRIERVFVVDHLECARASSAVGRLAAQGLITPRVAGLFAPDEAGRAHSLVEAGGVRGRPVIRF